MTCFPSHTRNVFELPSNISIMCKPDLNPTLKKSNLKKKYVSGSDQNNQIRIRIESIGDKGLHITIKIEFFSVSE